MNLPNEIALLLDRYVAGTCSPAELLAIRSWIGDDPRRAELISRLRAARALERARVAPADVGKAVEHLKAAMARTARATSLPGPSASEPTSQMTTWRLLQSLRAIAMIGAVVGCAVFVVRLVGAGRAGQRSFREYTTRAGQRQSVTLADGTRFTLAPVSQLRVPTDYGAGHRTIALDGEAFFVVAHDATHPFSVQTSRAIATDVGTQFDVRAYADDPAVRVGVAEGQVMVGLAGGGCCTGESPTSPPAPALNPPAGRFALGAGDVATVGTDVAITRGADVAQMTAWLQGAVVFNATPLKDAIRDLDRMYDIDIVLADTGLASTRITTSVGPEPIDDVLASVTYAIGARYERSGRHVVIRRNESSSRAPDLETARGRPEVR